ncbi:pyruvate flavodoxin/ferredoxin oxidoreductase [Acididesulfobacillus acetoxydans]|uniref:Ketoisovalerate oxidoreductase subunit VorB n=1 Tax=Acididesulfobacillus acetoxydans TaxID=1561005 RepID=A0A8S0Y1U5_9FIRM|nr:3-methyl-2-oxobutanoate dehydrogenase subunit VorB [Acididesulfobacillus acetoxydans]CAA7599975.1 pyruvate flavodoxin/ferredoxin oxidoreductase [Acididesulfobacillus acetoxydans]CEJ07933.1 Ketoisovalerate oxidoreductase subunit VorB [Acididesulfobacillus acetoxydans]
MAILMKGNEAIAEAAIQAGCRLFCGYPITPSTEIPEYMAKKMKKAGGTYLQAESEVAAIYMVYGAGAAGARVMSGTSSPGFSLMQEGLSYLFAAEIPCVIADVMRGGPGLGGLGPTQADYFQLTKGGGHGDYHPIVLAPATVQEMIDLTKEAFDLADIYRNPVILAVDGILGQMMEPVEFPGTYKAKILPAKTWAADGCEGRPKNNVISYYLSSEAGEADNLRWGKKMAQMQAAEQRFAELSLDDAEYAFVAFGTSSRITETAIDMLRSEGVKVGLFRPISLWPFPVEGLQKRVPQIKGWMSIELSAGQMVQDVRLAVNGRAPVGFYGRQGGMIPEPEEIVAAFKTQILQGGVQR